MMKRPTTLEDAARKGGINRAKKLSPERRLEIAVKASLASKEARARRKQEIRYV